MPAADLLISLDREKSNEEDILKIAGKLIGSEEEKLYLKNLGTKLNEKKDDIQNVINNLQWILDTHGIVRGAVYSIRKELRRALSKLCKATDMYPSELYINDLIWDESQNIGGGFHSDVFIMARKSQPTVHVSVKRLRVFGEEATAELRRNLCREAMLFRQLRHVRINEMLGVYIRHDGRRPHLSVISTYCEGGTLVEYQKKKKKEEGTIADPIPLLAEIAEGLAWLHGEGIVHGDVKGANVIVDKEEHIKIIDFGISIVLEATEGPTGKFGMTELWGAPELHLPSEYGFEKAKASLATDVYSFAHTMVESYTLERPSFQQDVGPGASKPTLSHFETVQLIVKGQRPLRPSIEHCHGRIVSDELWVLIQECWHGRIVERPLMNTVYDSLVKIQDSAA